MSGPRPELAGEPLGALPATLARTTDQPVMDEAAPRTDATAAAAPAAKAPPKAAAAAPAAPPPPGGPGPVDTGQSRARDQQRWRGRRHRRLHRLSIGQHVAPDEALDQLQLTSVTCGLWLGRNQAGGPVTLPLFRPAPTRVVLIGGMWAATLVAFRALGFGARAVVFTHDATGWIGLGRRATGRPDRVAVLGPGSPVSMVASAGTPMLRLVGADLSTQGDVPSEDELPAWTTELSVLSRITLDQSALLARADIVLAQRLSPDEAATLTPILGLREPTSYTLQALHDDMLAVLTPTGIQYLWVSSTGVEQELLGRPRRF